MIPGQKCWKLTVELPLDYEPNLPPVQIDELHIRKSDVANGYEIECVLLGKHVGNIRMASITIENILMAIQACAKAAWAAQKHDIAVANFDMTVNRGAAQP